MLGRRSILLWKEQGKSRYTSGSNSTIINNLQRVNMLVNSISSSNIESKGIGLLELRMAMVRLSGRWLEIRSGRKESVVVIDISNHPRNARQTQITMNLRRHKFITIIPILLLLRLCYVVQS